MKPKPQAPPSPPDRGPKPTPSGEEHVLPIRPELPEGMDPNSSEALEWMNEWIKKTPGVRLY